MREKHKCALAYHFQVLSLVYSILLLKFRFLLFSFTFVKKTLKKHKKQCFFQKKVLYANPAQITL